MKEFMSPPTMSSYLGSAYRSFSRSYFRLATCDLFFYLPELRCTQAKMKLSAPTTAMLSAQRRPFFCYSLIWAVTSLNSRILPNDCLFSKTSESCLGSMVTWNLLLSCSSSSSRSEYSWMKKTSDLRVSRLAMNLSNFLSSLRKLIW